MRSGIEIKGTGRVGFRLRRFVEICPPLLLLMLVSAILQAPPAGAAEDPEALYRKGRFEEAEKAYEELDMDHPKDARYRYNRGCAAYRHADYQGAGAAFSSVLKRSEDKAVRLRAAYNLGNAAYKQGDYKSAAAYYRQAVLLDPSHGDARYNFELALRALEKQKKEQKKERSPQQGGGEGTEEQGGSEKGEKSGDEATRNQEGKKSDAQKEPQDGQRGDSKGEGGKDPQGQEKGGADEKKSAEQTPPKDLSGELKPLRDLANQTEGGEDEKAAGSLSGIDRKKAEALLDNIKENRSRYLRFLVPEEKKRGVVSGKDW